MRPETAKWLQQILTGSSYASKDRIYEEFDEILTQYNGLNPIFDKHVFGGCLYNLLGMKGVIPVTYRSVTYNIPIGVWIMYDYPITPPEFVVMPTENMKIVVSKHVKSDGVITHPYLDVYSSKPQNSMIEFISILRKIFSTETPVVEVKQPIKSQPQSSQSYSMPQPVSMPMPRPSYLYNGTSTTSSTSSNPSYMPYNYPYQQNYPLGHNTSTGSASSSTNSLSRTNTKSSVINEVREKINKDVESINKELKSKIDELLDENKVLLENEKKITSSMYSFEEEMLKIKSSITLFQGKNSEISQNVEQLRNKEEINPDEILKLTPLMNQLVQAVSDEAALEDMIYYLGKALTSEQIDLNYYLKHIRSLSREQFLKKALIKKIRVQGQLM